VHELIDQLAVDKIEKVGRGSTSVTATSSALKMVAYSTPITPAQSR